MKFLQVQFSNHNFHHKMRKMKTKAEKIAYDKMSQMFNFEIIAGECKGSYIDFCFKV